MLLTKFIACQVPDYINCKRVVWVTPWLPSFEWDDSSKGRVPWLELLIWTILLGVGQSFVTKKILFSWKQTLKSNLFDKMTRNIVKFSIITQETWPLELKWHHLLPRHAPTMSCIYTDWGIQVMKQPLQNPSTNLFFLWPCNKCFFILL